MPKPRIAYIHSDWDLNEYRSKNDLYGGIGYYRVIKPAQVLSKWFDVDVVGADFEHWGTDDEKYGRLGKYDLIISKHLRTGIEVSNLLGTAKHFKKKVLLDIDDNYTAIREDNPAFKDYVQGKGAREFIGAFISLSNGVIVSTSPLKKVYKVLNKKIDVLPNCNDINDWPKQVKKWNDGKVRIGFAGGQGHLADLHLIAEPMAYILAKYPNVLLEIVGTIWPKEAMGLVVKMNELCKKDISKQVRIAGGTLAFKEYPEMLASFGWDIVIAPLIPDEFNKCKSHIRWMEATMIKCPVIASPVYPYKEKIQGVNTIEDGLTGLFAYDSQSWYERLSFLIEHPDGRKQLADNAYKYIKENWQWKQWEDEFKKVVIKYL